MMMSSWKKAPKVDDRFEARGFVLAAKGERWASSDAGAAAGAGGGKREKSRLNAASGARMDEGQGLIGGEWKKEKGAGFLEDRLAMFERFMEDNRAALAAKPKNPIKITLPDGKEIDGVSWETTPMDIAAGLSKSLAKQACVAKVVYSTRYESDADKFVTPDEQQGEEEEDVDICDALKDKLEEESSDAGELWDMHRPLEGDCKISILKFDHPDGKMTFWHSSAHVLGESMEVTYGVKLTIGPPTADGFYYDAYMGEDAIGGEEDYKAFKDAALKIAKENQTFERCVLTKEQAIELFGDNPFKVQLISKKIPDGGLTTAYRCGSLIDLCKGPHLPSTGRIKTFEVMKHSGTNWLGNTGNDKLQRVYAVSFPDNKLMKAHLKRIAEAKERDHRHIGGQQELFFFNDLSPGSAFWMPAGAHIFRKLQDMIRELYRARGFKEVITPNVFNLDLWRTSGHYQHYKENMFIFKCEDQEFGLKPMNCPGHAVMFGHRSRSYKELPLRVADFGVLHRNEFSGALSGLTRVRRFQQDDAHIFCRPDQIEEEVAGALDFMATVYDILGMRYELVLSTRPKKALGDRALWDRAEVGLRTALDAFGHPWGLNPGDGAFYGPKIDIKVYDALGRLHQCATIQLDFQLPIRFDLKYVGPAGTDSEGGDNMERPVMIHRAVLGSVERMTAVLCEHYGGKWPFWLSPRQVMIIPIHNKDGLPDYADEVRQMLFDAGFEAEVELSGKTQKKKLREAQLAGYNFILTVGNTEMAEKSVNVRERDTSAGGGGRGATTPVVDFVERLKVMAKEHK